jgi:hypothetical protein
MAEELVISKDTVHPIVREDLGKRKTCSHFVTHKLTDEQKAKRMETSGDFITRDQDPSFLRTIVIGMRPGTASSIRNPSGNRLNGVHHLPRDPKSRLEKSKVKTMLIAFDSDGIIH